MLKQMICLIAVLACSSVYGQDIGFMPYPPPYSGINMMPVQQPNFIPPNLSANDDGWEISQIYRVKILRRHENAEGWYMNNYGQWQRNLPQGYQPSPCNPYIYQCPQPQYYYPQQNYYNYQRRFFSPGG